MAVGAAVATLVAAVVIWSPRREQSAVVDVPPRTVKADVEPASPPPTVFAVPPAPIVASRPRRTNVVRPRVQPALLVDGASATRIVFTAPKGTRILWFVGAPDAKELGS